MARKSNYWESWRTKLIVLNKGDVDLKRTPEGNDKARRNVLIERSQLHVQKGSEGVAGLRLHQECSLPAPAASNDPLTHFLPAAPAACQGEPLLEDDRGGGWGGKRGLDTRGGKKKAKARDARN